MPLVSVIINCFNGEKYLRSAIDSVYSQTFNDWEIILWDNASTDSSPEIAKSYDRKLRYFRGDKKVMLGEARNYAMSKMSGKYMAFLDCDDLWCPEKLEKQVKLLESDASLAFVYGNYYRLLDKNVKRVAFSSFQPQGFAFKKLLIDYTVGLLTTLVRKQSFEKSGLCFDNDLTYSEDFDFFMRLAHNSKIAYMPEPLAIYRIHQEMSSCQLADLISAEFHYVINKLRTLDTVITEECDKAVSIFERNNTYSRARFLLKNGEYRNCRKFIHDSRIKSIKLILLYLLTFFPLRIVKKMLIKY